MSKQTLDLLEACDALAIDDQQAFALEILRRTREWPFDSGPTADEEIGEAGKALFGLLERLCRTGQHSHLTCRHTTA
jgi:hypothetical protein